jgi:hypothetical protein
MILTQRTELETDLAERDASVLRCAEAIRHAAAILGNEHARFWGLPTERLLAVLNHDVQSTLALFGANSSFAQAANTALDELNLPGFAIRAPIESGRADIVFQDGAFVHVPAPEPEPEA